MIFTPRGCIVLYLAAGFSSLPVFAESGSVDRYALPRDKSRIEPCMHLAMKAHPGTIKEIHEHATDQSYHYEFEIMDRKGSFWVVTCDTVKGKIIKEQLIE